MRNLQYCPGGSSSASTEFQTQVRLMIAVAFAERRKMEGNVFSRCLPLHYA